MTTERHDAIAEARIRQLVDGLVKGIRAKDVDEVMSSSAPDILWFDFMVPFAMGEQMPVGSSGNNV